MSGPTRRCPRALPAPQQRHVGPDASGGNYEEQQEDGSSECISRSRTVLASNLRESKVRRLGGFFGAPTEKKLADRAARPQSPCDSARSRARRAATAASS